MSFWHWKLTSLGGNVVVRTSDCEYPTQAAAIKAGSKELRDYFKKNPRANSIALQILGGLG